MSWTIQWTCGYRQAFRAREFQSTPEHRIACVLPDLTLTRREFKLFALYRQALCNPEHLDRHSGVRVEYPGPLRLERRLEGEFEIDGDATLRIARVQTRKILQLAAQRGRRAGALLEGPREHGAALFGGETDQRIDAQGTAGVGDLRSCLGVGSHGRIGEMQGVAAQILDGAAALNVGRDQAASIEAGGAIEHNSSPHPAQFGLYTQAQQLQGM